MPPPTPIPGHRRFPECWPDPWTLIFSQCLTSVSPPSVKMCTLPFSCIPLESRHLSLTPFLENELFILNLEAYFLSPFCFTFWPRHKTSQQRVLNYFNLYPVNTGAGRWPVLPGNCCNRCCYSTLLLGGGKVEVYFKQMTTPEQKQTLTPILFQFYP